MKLNYQDDGPSSVKKARKGSIQDSSSLMDQIIKYKYSSSYSDPYTIFFVPFDIVPIELLQEKLNTICEKEIRVSPKTNFIGLLLERQTDEDKHDFNSLLSMASSILLIKYKKHEVKIDLCATNHDDNAAASMFDVFFRVFILKQGHYENNQDSFLPPKRDAIQTYTTEEKVTFWQDLGFQVKIRGAAQMIFDITEADKISFDWDTQNTKVTRLELVPTIKNIYKDGYVFKSGIGMGSQFGTVWKIKKDNQSFVAKIEQSGDVTEIWENSDISRIRPEIFGAYEIEGTTYHIVIMEKLQTIDWDDEIDNKESEKYQALIGLIKDTAAEHYVHDDINTANILVGPTTEEDKQYFNTYFENNQLMKVVWGDLSSLSKSSRGEEKCIETMIEKLDEELFL